MLADNLDNLNIKQRAKIQSYFLNAAIIYYLGGDWKEEFKEGYRKSIGSVKQFCKSWVEKGNDRNFERAINILFDNLEGNEYVREQN